MEAGKSKTSHLCHAHAATVVGQFLGRLGIDGDIVDFPIFGFSQFVFSTCFSGVVFTFRFSKFCTGVIVSTFVFAISVHHFLLCYGFTHVLLTLPGCYDVRSYGRRRVKMH